MGRAAVRCSVCDHVNAIDARFCSQCGSALAPTCPSCSASVEPDARFCSSCGTHLPTGDGSPANTTAAAADRDLARYVPEALLHKIRAARAGGSMRGERRTVTMLFADIQGSTAAAERLDPEEWADIVNGAFERLIAPVYRYEGTLARLQGDAILAFFGAPIAHEDDPTRAVLAGLEGLEAMEEYNRELRQRTDVPIAVRVGINTGLVVVGEVGSDLRVEYTALGDAVNVAARMEQTAQPGTVRITRDTADLLAGAFQTTPIGVVDVKGKAEPVEALRVDGRAGGSTPAVAATPLIGRDEPRAALAGLVERVAAGVGGVATVVGEAGIGKSRLLAAACHDAAAMAEVATTSTEPGDLGWLEGHCRSFEAGVPYTPFLDLGARWLGFAELHDDVLFEHIAAAVARAFGEPDLDTAAYLTTLTGAPLPDAQAALVAAIETPALHEKTTQAIVHFLEAEAKRRPLVIVLEDLHWADDLSLAMAERLIASTERVPIALVLAMRPARKDPSWRLVETARREDPDRSTDIQLEALDPAAAGALLEYLLGDREVAPDVRRRILERADGNPLFVEEIVGSLEQAGTADIPASLSGLLTARLDRLDEEPRLVAEVAAVVGKEFDPDAVSALVDDVDVRAGISRLVRAGVLTERRRLPHPVFAFRHALVQEAAYATILRKDRRRLHDRLARYLEASGRDEPHEIARHHLAGTTPTAAFPWLVEAAARSARVMALADAIRLYTAALDNVPKDADPALVGEAHDGLGEAYALLPDLDQASAAYQALADYGRSCERPSLQVRALNRLGLNAAAIAADYDQANRYLLDARHLAEESGDEVGLAEYHMNACFVAVAQGDLARATHHDAETARLGQAAGVDEIRVLGLVRRAMNLIASAEFDGIEEALAEARKAATRIRAEEPLALLAANGEALMRERDGDLAGAFDIMTEATRTLDRYGSSFLAFANHHAGRLALWRGDLETVMALLTETRRVAERQGPDFVAGAAAATLALAYAVCGDEAAAADNRAAALTGLSTPMGDYLASTLWADLGFTNIELANWQAAEADFTVGLETSSTTRFWERPRLLTGLARVVLEGGDTGRSRDLLDQAAAYATERGLACFRPLIGYTAGLIARGSGDLSGAERHLDAASRDATTMGMDLLACDIAMVRSQIAAATGRHGAATELRDLHVRLATRLNDHLTDTTLREGLGHRLGLRAAGRPEPTRPTEG